MLKIMILNEWQATIFVVEGKLAGLWVKELEKCWEGALAAELSVAMVVNVAEVTFIDCDGRELLTRMLKSSKSVKSERPTCAFTSATCSSPITNRRFSTARVPDAPP